MDDAEIIEERVRFSAKPALTGMLGYPAAGEPVRAVLLCPPHPHFAGDMDNNVVRALARGLASDSVTLRFDYRGVGDSEIDLPPGVSVFDYWDDVEQKKDYRDALTDVAAAFGELTRVADGLPVAIIGYSFGAISGLTFGLRCGRVAAMAGVSPPLKRLDFGFLAGCSTPCLLLCGTKDFVYSDAEAARLASQCGPNVALEQWADSDHFFRGEEDKLCCRVRRFLDECTARATPTAAGQGGI